MVFRNVTKKIPHEQFFKKGFTTNKHASDVIQGACGRLYFAECKRSRNIRKPGLPRWSEHAFSPFKSQTGWQRWCLKHTTVILWNKMLLCIFNGSFWKERNKITLSNLCSTKSLFHQFKSLPPSNFLMHYLGGETRLKLGNKRLQVKFRLSTNAYWYHSSDNSYIQIQPNFLFARRTIRSQFFFSSTTHPIHHKHSFQ
jgi:hypothetical protein